MVMDKTFLFKTMTKANDEDIQISAWQPLDSQTSEEIDISSVKVSTEKNYTLYRVLHQNMQQKYNSQAYLHILK
jgi:hypothetical protein